MLRGIREAVGIEPLLRQSDRVALQHHDTLFRRQ